MDDDARFPIQRGPSILWSEIAPHEAQARRNHGQTLKRLAERGGLDPTEALAVLEDRDYPIGTFDVDQHRRWFADRVRLADERRASTRDADLAALRAKLAEAERERDVQELIGRAMCGAADHILERIGVPADAREDIDPEGFEAFVLAYLDRNLAPALARDQPCGCRVCVCATTERCLGCGATCCAKHGPAPGTLHSDPGAVWEPHPLLARAEKAEAKLAEAERERNVAISEKHWIMSMLRGHTTRFSADVVEAAKLRDEFARKACEAAEAEVARLREALRVAGIVNDEARQENARLRKMMGASLIVLTGVHAGIAAQANGNHDACAAWCPIQQVIDRFNALLSPAPASPAEADAIASTRLDGETRSVEDAGQLDGAGGRGQTSPLCGVRDEGREPAPLPASPDRARVPCSRCGGSSNDPDALRSGEGAVSCMKCGGTGETRVVVEPCATCGGTKRVKFHDPGCTVALYPIAGMCIASSGRCLSTPPCAVYEDACPACRPAKGGAR